MRFLDHVETAAAILCGIAMGVQGLADESPIGGSVAFADLGHGNDFIDDARQFVAGFGAVDLRDEGLAIEIVEFLVEDPYEPDVLAPGVLQVGQPGDHLLAVQTVGAPHVGFAGTLGDRLRLAFCPLQAQTAGDRDAVDKYRFVLVEAGRVAEALQSIRDRYVYSNFCCEVVGSLASTVYSETDAHWSD